ncbi:MAG: hypothetical protein JWP55_4865, partial [Mycobacterium sp.]|nr:hypothetical protein [Mycobacterium sp.]
MAKSRSVVLLTAIALLVVIAGSWFLLISPKKAEAADLTQKAAAEQSAQSSLQQQISMLKQDEKQEVALKSSLDKVATHLPLDAALPSLIREMTHAADVSNVAITEITPSVPTAANASLLPAPVVKPTPTGTAAAPTPTDGASTPPVAAVTPPGLVLSQLPISFTVVGRYSDIAIFVNSIQNFRRAFLVQTVSVSIDDTANKNNGYGGVLIARISASAFTSGTPVQAGLEATDLATPTA